MRQHLLRQYLYAFKILHAEPLDHQLFDARTRNINRRVAVGGFFPINHASNMVFLVSDPLERR
jgi:hypothetical protein